MLPLDSPTGYRTPTTTPEASPVLAPKRYAATAHALLVRDVPHVVQFRRSLGLFDLAMFAMSATALYLGILTHNHLVTEAKGRRR